MDLEILGWNRYSHSINYTEKFSRGKLARVAIENRGGYLLYSDYGEIVGIVQGKFMRGAKNESDYPKVGDWVVIEKLQGENKAIIESILPRKAKISRKRAGEDIAEQIIATNIDIAFIVQGLDGDFNLSRLERYIAMAKEGGCEPIVLLNKCDLLKKDNDVLDKIKIIIGDVKYYLVSAKTGEGIAEIKSLITEGVSVVFVGSSGVGKSTLINAILGSEKQKTSVIRFDDSKGRHTTTKRELIILPSGGLLIDTPGMRELGLWASQDSIEETFYDIEEFVKFCKFNDCNHMSDKGCAVIEAVKNEMITKQRYDAFVKLCSGLDPLKAKKAVNNAYAQKRAQRRLIKRPEFTKDK